MLTKIISVSLLLFLTFLSGCAPAQLNKTEGVSSEYESKNSEKSEELQSSEATEIKQVSIYQGDFELPLDGATGYASVALDVKNDLSTSSTVLSQLNPGAVFTILKEQDDWLQIQTETIIGWVQKPYILINLPDVIPSIIYKNTKNKGQYLLVGLMTFVTFVVSVSDRYCNHRGFYQIFNVFNDYTKVIEHISLNMNVCLIILYFI